MSILPDDEDLPHEHCPVADPHADHYWRADGKRFRYLDDPTARYCPGDNLTMLGDQLVRLVDPNKIR